MTTKEILDLYEIKMITSYIGGSLETTFLGGGDMEPFFENLYADVENLSNLIIKIQHYIDGNSPPWEDGDGLGGMGTMAYIEVDTGLVRFNNPYTGEVTQVVPLDHFKVIAEAWRDFLVQNGW